MRVLYLHQYFKKPEENGGTRSYDLSTSLFKKGIDVEVITTTSEPMGFNGKRWRVENVDGVKVHYLYLPYDNAFSAPKRVQVFLIFLWHSLIKLLRMRGDVVLATSTPLTIGLPALIKKIIHGTPYIFEVRDVWPEAVIAVGAIRKVWMQKFLYKLEDVLYRHSSFIVTLSTDMRISIQNRYPNYRNKSQVVIENISEISRFQPTGDLDDNGSSTIKRLIGFVPEVSILYAGTFGKVNHIEYIINLAVQLLKKDPSIVFLLMGNGAEKERLIQDAKRNGVFENNVFFLNAIGKRDLPQIYQSVSMGSSFVAPIKELWANSANKFFDTLAAGKPILINHGGWQKNIINSNRLGYVLEPILEENDLQEFIDFVKNKNTMRDAGIHARKIAVEKYSLEVAVKKYIELLSVFNNTAKS